MANEEAKEAAGEPGETEKSGSGRRVRQRRKALTPEQRRLLDTPRAPRPAAQEEPEANPEPPPRSAREPEPSPEKESPPAKAARIAKPMSRPSATPIVPEGNESRATGKRYAIFILGTLLFVGLAFFGGTKLNRLRSLIASRHDPVLADKTPDRFPNILPEDLVLQGLAAEKEGDWKGAIERFMAAKRKDLHYRGLLVRCGTILYEHQDYTASDSAFERAIAFHENVDVASFYRGLIAARRGDYSAAEQMFQAAATTSPFVADYQYYCGETNRLDQKPIPAIPFYEQAALLAQREQDATVCRFKIRMARIEATQGEAVSAELAKKTAAGPLSVDWLMTSAALAVRNGQPAVARAAIQEARDRQQTGLFASCVNDFYFKDAATKFPELASALQLEPSMRVPFPR